MEFILVAHAIIVGLAVAEVLRGISELFRSKNFKISYRLLLIAVWTLLLLLQVWWSIWHVSGHAVWTFSEFLLFLLPVGILYIIARLCFPADLNDVDLDVYYSRVAQKIWWLVAATYAFFAFWLRYCGAASRTQSVVEQMALLAATADRWVAATSYRTATRTRVTRRRAETCWARASFVPTSGV